MKKKIILLWIASFVIVFLAAYLSNLIDKYYPIASTIGIEGKKVTYRFEKISYGKDDYTFMIRTDVNDLIGKLYWKNKADTIWQSEQLKKSDLVLTSKIPALKPEKSLLYFAELNYKGKKYIIPDNQKVNLTFFGKIPFTVTILEFLLMYFGLVLSVRTGLEYFNSGKDSKKLGVFTILFFLTLIALVNPLYLTYKYGFINSSIPPIDRLFLWTDLIIFTIWTFTIIAIFKLNKLNFLPLVTGVITLIIFVVFR